MRTTVRSCAIVAVLGLSGLAHAAPPIVDVFKTATCGCCEEWTRHLQENGFTVKVNNVPDPGDYRQKFGIPKELGSCHSAKVGGYAIEGHVPAADIKRLLASRAKARGLAVPGMPMGSPGMEMGQREAYDVLLVKPDGKTTVFKRYAAQPHVHR